MTKTIGILAIIFTIFSCNNSTHEIEKLIEDFRSNQIPDSRESIFVVKVISKKGNVILSGETDNIDYKNQLFSLLNSYSFIDSVKILPDSQLKTTFGLINLSVANLRTTPKHSAELATQALLGTPVKILKQKSGWYLVQTPDRYISWIDNAEIKPLKEPEFGHWKNSKRAIFTGMNGTIYQKENLKEPMSDVTLGNILQVTGQKQQTTMLKFPDGRTGYTDSKLWIDFETFKNKAFTDTVQMTMLANQLIGRPYLWGGTSVRAMDCSGFVKTIYFMSGIILARDASLQSRHGQLVNSERDFNIYKNGDLLFFGTPENDNIKEKVTHVAYSLGRTEYIHAAGRIKRNSFNPESKIYSESRKNSFIRARRILGSEGEPGVQELKNHPWY